MKNSDAYIKPGLKTVDECIAEAFGLSVDDLQLKTRKRTIVDARKFAMWWQRETYGEKKPYAEIGAMYAGKDHATAIKAFKKDHNDLMVGDAGYKEKAERALKFIESIKPIIHE
nr:helix-turn-helix domain-containing protein [uncultured Draconibacterium sp.]